MSRRGNPYDDPRTASFMKAGILTIVAAAPELFPGAWFTAGRLAASHAMLLPETIDD
jgi:hypothetical protein